MCKHYLVQARALAHADRLPNGAPANCVTVGAATRRSNRVYGWCMAFSVVRVTVVMSCGRLDFREPAECLFDSLSVEGESQRLYDESKLLPMW